MFRKTIIFLLINIIAFLVVCSININPVYAENNSFVPRTLIFTPNGNIPMEELHSGDRAIGYNFETHQEEIHHVKDIRQSSSLSYYLINNQTKITGTHYVYVKTPNNPKIESVQQLKVNDQLLGQNHQDYAVDKIEQIVKPVNLYRIILEERNSNFFIDHFLIYSGNKIPNNFKKNYIYINCEPGTIVYEIFDSRHCPNINSQTIPGIALGLLILVIASLISFKVFDWIEKINSL